MKKIRIRRSLALLTIGLYGLLALTLLRSRPVLADLSSPEGRRNIASSGLDWPQQTEPGNGYPPPTMPAPTVEGTADPQASPTGYPGPAELDPFAASTPAPDIFEPAGADDAGMLPPPPDAPAEETPQSAWVRNTLILWVGFIGGLLVFSGGIYASILLYRRRNE